MFIKISLSKTFHQECIISVNYHCTMTKLWVSDRFDHFRQSNV